VATSSIEIVAESSHHLSFRVMPSGRRSQMRRRFQADGQGDDDFRVCMFGGWD